jgi:Transposase DDE domain
MTPNRSLVLSLELKNLMRTDLLHHIDADFPFDLIDEYKPVETTVMSRDRVYNVENTLLTMVMSAFSEDKSLKQSVITFKQVFELKGEQLKQTEDLALQKAKDAQLSSSEFKRPGRPSHFLSHLPKSKIKEVSDNTAAYTKARGRLELGLVKKVFDYSADSHGVNPKRWYDMKVAVTDGTYFQMQDTKELKAKYFIKEGDSAYPQGLLQCILCQGSGQIMNFKIGTRHQSELELVKPLISQLEAGTLLLADDLYSTYAIFSLIQKQGCHLIVPGKRERNYEVLKKIADGDEIVSLNKTKKPEWLSKEEWADISGEISLRRISYPSLIDETKEWILFTTITNEAIKKEAIILKYVTRWDIEITIREIKTIMGINIARSKTEDMVFKEITVALTAYNMIRKMIAKSVDETDFSPQGHFFQKCFEANEELLIDKKGRLYQRWSPGRYGKAVTTDQTTSN